MVYIPSVSSEWSSNRPTEQWLRPLHRQWTRYQELSTKIASTCCWRLVDSSVRFLCRSNHTDAAFPASEILAISGSNWREQLWFCSDYASHSSIPKSAATADVPARNAAIVSIACSSCCPSSANATTATSSVHGTCRSECSCRYVLFRPRVDMFLIYSFLAQQARSLFSQNQLAALKYQILAYKLISKNMPLPANLQQAVFSSLSAEEISSPSTDANVPRPSIEPAAAAAAAAAADGGVVPSPSSGSAVPNAATKGPSPASAAKIASPRQQPTAISKTPEYNAYASPYHLLKKPVSSYVHASRLHRQLIPSITPIGIDPQSITDNRERKINECILDRINQLEKLSGAMVEKLAKRGGGVALTPLKSLIELKSLKLLGRQKKVCCSISNSSTY